MSRKIALVMVLAVLCICRTPIAQAESNSLMKSCEVGDIITFGTYEQDNDPSNGAEPVEWLVLDVEDGRALVLSRYCLDAQPYNTKLIDTTWEICTLRSWLNDTFLNTAFTTDEQKLICPMTMSNSDNLQFGTGDGTSTTDRVFLLSIAEAEKYFCNDEARAATSTAYAAAQGAWSGMNAPTPDGEVAAFWWLRSPGDVLNCAAGGNADGGIYYEGLYVNFHIGAVRPALYINLKS